ncbi:MAG: hypothetical protein WAO75_01000 [Atribacterales bacterium]
MSPREAPFSLLQGGNPEAISLFLSLKIPKSKLQMSFVVSFNEERAKIRGKERSHEREKRSELKLSDIEGYDNVMVRFG